ncbi:hypothetical protein N431DRAFT_346550, partial [Stipitochalara longipes BDJ]
ASPVLSNSTVSSSPHTMEPDPTPDDGFDEVTESISLVWISSAIMDMNELILEEQFKTRGVESLWEKALVKHKAELQQGLDQIKKRMEQSNKKDAMIVDVKEIPTIVVQEPESEDARKMSFIVEDSSRQEPETEVSASTQSLSTPSTLQQQPDDYDEFVITAFLPEEEANAALASLDEFSDLDTLSPSFIAKLRTNYADFEESSVGTSDEILVRDQNVLLKSSEEPLSTFLASVAPTSPIEHLSAAATALNAESKNAKTIKGTKRGLHEAGLENQEIAQHADAMEREGSIATPAKKRQETANRTAIDPAKLLQVPKTPFKGKTPHKKAKNTPASRHSPRKRH